jgi:hypothetical protein
MAERKPLVLVKGQPQELPSGDVLPAQGSIPFYKTDGTSDTIALTASSAVPFYETTGSANNIPLVT